MVWWEISSWYDIEVDAEMEMEMDAGVVGRDP